MATFASTVNEAVAEAASTADNPSTADEDVATLVSTVAEAVAKASSTADEDVAHTAGGGSVGTIMCVSCSVSLFLF